MRAAEVRAREVNDAPGAIAILDAVLQRFGPDRDVTALVEQLQARGKSSG